MAVALLFILHSIHPLTNDAHVLRVLFYFPCLHFLGKDGTTMQKMNNVPTAQDLYEVILLYKLVLI